MAISGDKFWNKPCYTFTINDCIKNNYLVDFKVYGTLNGLKLPKIPVTRDFTEKELAASIKEDKIPNQVDEIYNLSNKLNLKKVCIIAANIKHAKKISKVLDCYEENVLIHSNIKNANEVIEDYKNNDIRFSISITMIAEGFDCPKIDGIVLLRATNSSRLLTQIIGRGLRLFPGKKECIVLDYSESFLRCGSPKNPKIPNIKIQNETFDKISMIQCEGCFYIYERTIGRKCPDCGHVNTVTRDPEKNLKKSIYKKEELLNYEITSNTLKSFGKAKNGNRYMKVLVRGQYLFFFGYQYKRILSDIKKNSKCKVYYRIDGKFLKFVMFD